MPALFLTERDRELIQGLLDREGKGTPARKSLTVTGEGHQSPETYIAMPPSGGIPARSSTTLGSATCDIYRINNGRVEQVAGLTREVFNVSEDAVPGSEYLPVHRSKFGKWFAYHTASSNPKVSHVRYILLGTVREPDNKYIFPYTQGEVELFKSEDYEGGGWIGSSGDMTVAVNLTGAPVWNNSLVTIGVVGYWDIDGKWQLQNHIIMESDSATTVTGRLVDDLIHINDLSNLDSVRALDGAVMGFDADVDEVELVGVNAVNGPLKAGQQVIAHVATIDGPCGIDVNPGEQPCWAVVDCCGGDEDRIGQAGGMTAVLQIQAPACTESHPNNESIFAARKLECNT